MPIIVTNPPHSIVFISDRSVCDIPETLAGNLVTYTRSCVVVGTLAFMDGSTRVSLDRHHEPHDLALVFDGLLETPSKVLSVSTSHDETLMELELETERTRVRIWVNDPREPDDIRVVATPAP
jgi:hypothetical protein